MGSVGEEAVKLLQALQEWAKESGQEYARARWERRLRAQVDCSRA